MNVNTDISIDQTRPRPDLSTLTGEGIDLGEGVVAEICTITPQVAAQWLKANRVNRPVTKSHVNFLSQQIRAGQWMLNGQAIIISDGENILDGQHRLLAVIDAGIPIQTMVIYGITQEAFKTIDTGRPRTAADALALWNNQDEHPKTIASAVRHLQKLESEYYGRVEKMSNIDVIEYVAEHPSIIVCCEYVLSLPKDSRVLSLACGIALYEFFQRKHAGLARTFITNVFVGENLTIDQPEYLLRGMLQRDSSRLQKYPADIRMKMAIKAWNLCRRNQTATKSVIGVQVDDPKRYKAL